MAVLKQNGDIIPFLKQKDYVMVNNDLGGGSFGKTVLLQDPFIDELFVAKNMSRNAMESKNNSTRISLKKSKYYTNSITETSFASTIIMLTKAFLQAISLWSTLTAKYR